MDQLRDQNARNIRKKIERKSEEVQKEDIIKYPHSNFTETRQIKFMFVKNYTERTISVGWFIWIDGEIAESNPDVFTRIKIEDLEKYKEERTNWANQRIPYLLETMKEFKKIEANQ